MTGEREAGINIQIPTQQTLIERLVRRILRSYARDSIGTLQGEGRGKALLTIASCSFLLIGVQMIYPVLLPELQSSYGFSLGTSGILLSSLWLANAAGQIPGGVLADRIGEGAIMIVSTLLSAVAVLLIVTAQSVTALILLTVLLGIGLALFWCCTIYGT